ncbi:PAS domain S-box protein [Undibacterium sp. SXout20W]|uniref:PAS domain S-box protein n=1 Tax=Undibacterium sp. SXout20W TaxID=3413051 RepID=UPI003BF00C2B
MQSPRRPDDENFRLITLQECGLLDTPPEERFDRITLLAKQIFKTKIVLMSLIDENRQWFKSNQGLPATETCRNISFCGHAILSEEILHVPDASCDLRFFDNPLVTDAPNIRFYAGAPLHAKNGQRIGTLCLIDPDPRTLTDDELQILRNLADCMEHEIGNAQSVRQHNALLTLTRITSLTFQDPQILLRETLALGCQYLQVSTGVISQIQENESVIQVCYSTSGNVREGQRYLKESTFSDFVNTEHDVIYAANLSQSSFSSHPSYQLFKQESYIGIPLFVEGKRFGTLGFSDPQVRTNEFSDVEIEFVNVLGDWVNSTIKRQQLNQSIQRQQQLNDAVAKAQAQFIKGKDRGKGFDTLLSNSLRLTQSEYGFICEVIRNRNGIPYLKVCSIRDLGWDEQTIEVNKKAVQQGIEFENLDLLFDPRLDTKIPVISNNLSFEREVGDLPKNHPPLRHFLAIPIEYDGEVVAMLGIANSPTMYDKLTVDFLQPVTITIGQLVNAARIQRQHAQSEQRLANIIEGTNIGTWECHIPSGMTIFNERWAGMLGYTLAELSPTTVQTWLELCHPEDAKISAELIERHFNGELPYFDLTSRMRHKDGYWVWIRDRGCVVSWDENGQPLVMSGSHQDVTQERIAEEKLAHAYELLEQSNAAARIGTWEYDLVSRQINWSSVTKQIHEVDVNFQCNTDQALAFYKGKDSREHIHHLLTEAGTKGTRFDAEFKIITAKKNERWIRIIGLPQIKEGEICGIYGTLQDVTDSKMNAQALRDQAAHTQAIIDNVLDGIITVNHLGFIDAFNFAAANIFGYHKDELIGKHFSILLPINDKSDLDDRRDQSRFPFRADNISNLIGAAQEVEARRKDGSVFPIDLSVSAVKRQGRALYIGLVRDITERKRLEHIKNEFISTVSHELRTPLTSISGALGLILGGATGTLPESLTPLLNIASKNSQRLTFLINDLLDMEKLSAGKMHFDMQEYALAPMLSQAIDTNTTFGAQRKVLLHLQQPLPDVKILIDSQRFMQVISNLLSNAIKYSPVNETVDIATTIKHGHVRISVSDHGKGIPSEFRDRIFQKFAQADSSDTREKGGTGLGLAISRELVESMGGKIGFDSVTGYGAHFYVELPIVSGA